ncbi:MAG TPA: catalase family protein [Janthinobacterium sp.]|jgi:hypothetical protein|nr:catalase family protein [Janthinobacterium sp.]
MDTRAPVSPIVYEPAFEVQEKDEAEAQDGLLKTLHSISETTYKDSGHAIRSVHAKSHGLLRGQLQVLDNLPPVLAQGIFSGPGIYPVMMRLSTIPGDILDDSVSTPRGLSVKVIGVDGARLPGSEHDVTQDFVLVNGPVFAVPTAKKFLGNLKLLAATTDKAPGLKKILSAVLRGTERALEAVGGESLTLKTLGGHPQTHILGETFYSQAPILFGPYMAKVAVAPVSSELTALTKAPLNVNGKPNGLREAVVDFFRQTGAVWELRVQLCTDLEKMPIEDASVEWPEDISPYATVARITAGPQTAWSEARSRAVDDGMSFTPWHGVSAHRPIGSIMRVRKAAYEMSARFRAERNGTVMVEPKNLDDFPS